ncbi:hypothetical protein MKX96_12050 [Psychrobacillus sp. FSL W7-1493]|uniref:hypothetical protein n=1 Tax=Psychrobacillus sp. FSL W7-1493 TaxID=2921552 RepID=UPI0030FAD6F3
MAMRIIKSIYFLVFFLILFLGACGTEKKITQGEAEKIALEDAPKFKPNFKDFEIWDTEETDRGWIIMIISKEPTFEKPLPNIYYEIDKNGSILERSNFAVAE